MTEFESMFWDAVKSGEDDDIIEAIDVAIDFHICVKIFKEMEELRHKTSYYVVEQ